MVFVCVGNQAMFDKRQINSVLQRVHISVWPKINQNFIVN